MSIPPVVMLAGIQAASNVLQSGIDGLRESFQQLLSVTGASADGTRTGVGNQVATSTAELGETTAGGRIAQWARGEAIKQKLRDLGMQIESVLREAGVPFESPIQLAFGGGRLQVDGGKNQLPGQLESRLINSPSITDRLDALARTIGGGDVLRIAVAPGEGARIV